MSQQPVVPGTWYAVMKQDQVFILRFKMTPFNLSHIKLLCEHWKKEVPVIIHALFEKKCFQIGLLFGNEEEAGRARWRDMLVPCGVPGTVRGGISAGRAPPTLPTPPLTRFSEALLESTSSAGR